MGAAAAQRVVGRLLFGISPMDPITFASAAFVLLTAAAIAGVIPGVRVLRIDPARTLRQD